MQNAHGCIREDLLLQIWLMLIQRKIISQKEYPPAGKADKKKDKTTITKLSIAW